MWLHLQLVMEVWVEIGQLALDGFDFSPGWNQWQVAQADAQGDCITYIKLVEIFDIVGRQVEEDLVPEQARYFWEEKDAAIYHARAKRHDCGFNMSRRNFCNKYERRDHIQSGGEREER